MAAVIQSTTGGTEPPGSLNGAGLAEQQGKESVRITATRLLQNTIEHLTRQFAVPFLCTMTTFGLLSSVVCLAALFGFLSYRVLRLPTTVGTTILSLLLSLALILANGREGHLHDVAEAIVGSIDFNQVVLHGMLAFLLFAGALHLDLTQLNREKLPVAALSIFATALSAVMVAVVVGLCLHFAGIQVNAVFCLLFGALISPTDPIAVLEMLGRVGAPAALKTYLAGESLFNDGVGAVLFLALLENANSGHLPSPARFLFLLLIQAGGGLALGLALGYLVYRMLRLVDSYRVEVMLTLALAMGGYALADILHVSAPLEVIAAGIIVNGRARRFAMSEKTRRNVETFWDLTDEIMNVVLFLLIGLELLVVPMQRIFMFAGLLAIPAVLLCRWGSVGLVSVIFRRWHPHVPGSITILTWGGLRGGLSVALALSLPPQHGRSLALTMTYIIVIFSVIVQGLTVGPLLRRMRLEPS